MVDNNVVYYGNLVDYVKGKFVFVYVGDLLSEVFSEIFSKIFGERNCE